MSKTVPDEPTDFEERWTGKMMPADEGYCQSCVDGKCTAGNLCVATSNAPASSEGQGTAGRMSAAEGMPIEPERFDLRDTWKSSEMVKSEIGVYVFYTDYDALRTYATAQSKRIEELTGEVERLREERDSFQRVGIASAQRAAKMERKLAEAMAVAAFKELVGQSLRNMAVRTVTVLAGDITAHDAANKMRAKAIDEFQLLYSRIDEATK